MIEAALILLLLLCLLWWLNPWSRSSRRRERKLIGKPYWLDGHGY